MLSSKHRIAVLCLALVSIALLPAAIQQDRGASDGDASATKAAIRAGEVDMPRVVFVEGEDEGR